MLSAFWIIIGFLLIGGGIYVITSIGVILILLGVMSLLFGIRRDIPGTPWDEVGWSSFYRTVKWILVVGIIATIINRMMETFPVPFGISTLQGFMVSTFIFTFRDPLLVTWAILRRDPQRVLHKLSATVSLISWFILYLLFMAWINKG